MIAKTNNKMKKRIIITAVLIAFVGIIGFVLARNKKAIDAQKVLVDRSKIPVAVSITKATRQTVNGNLQLPATLEPSKQADISATTSGKIVSFRITLGSKVSAGQVIGSVDTRQQQMSMKDAHEALNKAQKDYQLYKELYEGNAGTAQSVKDAEHTLEAARIRVQQSGNQIGEGVIKAPISGIITEKKGEVGEYANSGVSLATVVDIYNLKAVVFVSEKDVYQLKLNQSANITADVLPGKSFTGKVSFISPVGDENHNYRVELSVNNKTAQLKAGTYINVAFQLDNNFMALQIPKIALVEGTKNPYVYVVKDGQALVRKITVDREIGENIEVTSGLQESEQVVTSGQINITNSSRVTITGK
jgi:RND family efflux transporter MFP subunit